MEIRFLTKEQSKKQQLEDFLKLSGAERFYRFLELSQMMKKFPTKASEKKNNNFVIEIKTDEKKWNDNIDEFLFLTGKHQVRMLMVGGVAVNFHGYQRHSADVDFWIDTTEENFKKLVTVFTEMGYEIDDFPIEVKEQKQNISIKFTPIDLNLELITNFSVNKSFEEAYNESDEAIIKGHKILKWRVLSLEDLITSKIKAGRPKDLLDIQQLREINKEK